MSQSRDFGPMAAQMRAALDRYEKNELIDLMTHLIRVYVMEETTPMTPDAQHPQALDELSRLTFPQLLLHLQMSLDLEELARFRVSGSDVFVSLGEKEFNLLGGAPDGEQPATESANEPAAAAGPPPAPEPEDLPPAPPSSPVTQEPDFEIDDLREQSSQAPAARTEAKRVTPAPPRPTPEPATRGGQRLRGGGLFGGSAGPVLRTTPPPPPPIAQSAPGDPSPQERAAQRSDGGSSESRGSRPGFEDGPPALADGDREVKSSNRFADLELD